MTLKQLEIKTGTPYQTLLEHKSRGLLPAEKIANVWQISEEQLAEYYENIDKAERVVSQIVQRMLLVLDDILGEDAVDKIADNHMETFQVQLEPMIKWLIDKSK